MTKIIEPGEMVLSELKVGMNRHLNSTVVQVGEWVEVHKDWKQRMRVERIEDGKVVLVWP